MLKNRLFDLCTKDEIQETLQNYSYDLNKFYSTILEDFLWKYERRANTAPGNRRTSVLAHDNKVSFIVLN